MAEPLRAEHQQRLERTIRGMAIDIARDAAVRKARDADQMLAERMEQHQFEVAGVADEAPRWMTVTLPFDHVFTTSTGRRASQLLRPQVKVGVEFVRVLDALAVPRTPAEPLVTLFVAVSGWIEDGPNITGAKLRVRAQADAGVQQDFEAVVHATFQGYGVIAEEQPDLEG